MSSPLKAKGAPTPFQFLRFDSCIDELIELFFATRPLSVMYAPPAGRHPTLATLVRPRLEVSGRPSVSSPSRVVRRPVGACRSKETSTGASPVASGARHLRK